MEVRFTVGTPIPFGVSEIANIATMVTQYGPTSALNRRPVDAPPLQIMKSSAPSVSPVGSGDTITYTVQVANADDGVQTGIDVTDVLPAGTTYVPGSVAADIEGTPIAAGDWVVLLAHRVVTCGPPAAVLTSTHLTAAYGPILLHDKGGFMFDDPAHRPVPGLAAPGR